MTDSGANPRLAFIGRLLNSTDRWDSVHALLAELCAEFGLRAAGIRWPADGRPSVQVETTAVARPGFRAPVPVLQQPPGLLWADGPVSDPQLLALAAVALGHSPLLRALIEPNGSQARMAQRLEDAGKVAGRVAHDLDNVFQGVTGFNALALESLPSDSPVRENLREVETAAQLGLKFCAQLHQLSRSGQARPLPSSVATALTREIARLTPQFPAVKFAIEVPASLAPVAVEGSGLQMILGHLLDNAAEACVKGGMVQVTVRPIELSSADLNRYMGNPAGGSHVEVCLADSGPGLTEEARRRMFVEPFFTTKYRHRGLSLAVVYRMLYAHRGGVQADSEPGQGTTIRLVLPLAATKVPAVEPGRSTGGSVR